MEPTSGPSEANKPVGAPTAPAALGAGLPLRRGTGETDSQPLTSPRAANNGDGGAPQPARPGTTPTLAEHGDSPPPHAHETNGAAGTPPTSPPVSTTPGDADNQDDDGPVVRRKRSWHDPYTIQEKLRALHRYRHSGLTIDAFCEREGLNSASLCKWRRQYADFGEEGLQPKPKVGSSKALSRGPFTAEQRREAVEMYLKSTMPREMFAKTWGISAGSLDNWVRRYRLGGPKALERQPRSKRADNLATIPTPVREEIKRTKFQFPTFGLRKIRDFLYRFRGMKVSAGGVRTTLKAAGIPPTEVATKRHRSSDKVRRFERARPGELWQSDITSYVIGWTKERVYLTVFLDDHSRFIVSYALMMQQRQELVIEALKEGIAKFGKPQEVLTDRGRQYFAWRGKSDFQKLLDREGIRHVVSRAQHPETLGKCERLWETIEREFWSRVQIRDLTEARERLGHFIAHYNFFRPHQSLDGMVPADRFFQAADPVRQSIEAKLKRDELQQAIDEKPRKPVYVVAQVGDHLVSVHGERGKLVVQTADGLLREMNLDEAGMPPKPAAKKTEQESSDERSDGTSSDSRAAAGETNPGIGAEVQAGGVRGAEEDAIPGPGAVGVGDGGAAGAGAQGGDVAARVLGRAEDEGGGGGGDRGGAGAGVADVATGNLWVPGWAVEAAEEPRAAAGDVRADGRDGGGAEKAARQDGAGAAEGEPADRAVEGDAAAAKTTGEDGAGGCRPKASHERQEAGGASDPPAPGKTSGSA